MGSITVHRASEISLARNTGTVSSIQPAIFGRHAPDVALFLMNIPLKVERVRESNIKGQDYDLKFWLRDPLSQSK